LNTLHILTYGGFVLLAGLWCGGCGRQLKVMEIDKSYDGREVEMNVGEVAEVKLAENPTTGYRWVFAAKPEPICKIADDSFEPGGSAPGAGGIHRWKFEAASSGTGAVKLEYRRPWEKNAAAGQTFKLNIRVR
jgi:predicted secreted protein